MVILENIDIDIDKAILQNIDIDKISNRFKFGISNRATTTQLAVVYFFRASVLFTIENAKFWPILTNLGCFVANLRFFCILFTVLNNVAVYQNGQLSGMPATILVLYDDTTETTKIKIKIKS